MARYTPEEPDFEYPELTDRDLSRKKLKGFYSHRRHMDEVGLAGAQTQKTRNEEDVKKLKSKLLTSFPGSLIPLIN